MQITYDLSPFCKICKFKVAYREPTKRQSDQKLGCLSASYDTTSENALKEKRISWVSLLKKDFSFAIFPCSITFTYVLQAAHFVCFATSPTYALSNLSCFFLPSSWFKRKTCYKRKILRNKIWNPLTWKKL